MLDGDKEKTEKHKKEDMMYWMYAGGKEVNRVTRISLRRWFLRKKKKPKNRRVRLKNVLSIKNIELKKSNHSV